MGDSIFLKRRLPLIAATAAVTLIPVAVAVLMQRPASVAAPLRDVSAATSPTGAPSTPVVVPSPSASTKASTKPAPTRPSTKPPQPKLTFTATAWCGLQADGMTEMRVDIKASVKLISAKLFHSPSHSTDPEPMIVSGTTAYGWAHYSSVDPVKPAPGFRWHVEIKAADGRKLVGSPQYC